MTSASIWTVAGGVFLAFVAVAVCFILVLILGRLWLWASGWPDGDPVWERVWWDYRHPEGRDKGWWRGTR